MTPVFYGRQEKPLLNYHEECNSWHHEDKAKLSITKKSSCHLEENMKNFADGLRRSCISPGPHDTSIKVY